MVKSKKRGKQYVASGLCDIEQPSTYKLPLEYFDDLGTPIVTASHWSDPDSQNKQGCWGDARIVLTPEAIYAAHLYTNQAVLVAVAGVANEEARGQCQHGAAGGPATELPQPQNIWRSLHEQNGLDTAFSTPLEHAGCFYVPATIWPGPRLPCGTAGLSRSLAASLGRPMAGTTIQVYAWPGKAQVFSREETAAANPPPATEVLLWPCTSATTGGHIILDEAQGAWTTAPPAPPPSPSPVRSNAKARGGSAAHIMAEEAARRHLAGRTLLAGNPVLLPEPGKQALYAVGAYRRDPASVVSNSGLHAALVGKDTAVRVLLGNERPPDAGTSAQEHTDGPVAKGVSGVDAAAVAAIKAVGGGADGPAAVAARRAAQLGAAALQRGFEGMGGLADHIRTLREHVALPLKAPQLFERLRLKPPRGVLLHGPPGCGKTMLACAAAADAAAALFVINGPDVMSEYHGESEAGLQGVFAAARAAAPAVVFIDELDALAPARGSAGGIDAAGEMSARVVSSLLTAMDGVGTSGPDGVVVLAATNRVDAVDAALRRPGRFDRELEIGVPSPAARLEILRIKLRGVQHSLSEEDIQGLAASAHGFVGADVAALCQEATMFALRRIVKAKSCSAADAARDGRLDAVQKVGMEDFRAARTRVRPSGMREVTLELPRVAWDDVGGHAAIKQRLREAVQLPQQRPDLFKRLGAKAPRGVLLYGPPGCSKTLLARAVATESGLNFLAVKGPELFSKYVGESEKAVVTLFSRARAAAPSIVFFDEIDGLARARSQSGQGGGPPVGDRVLSQLLVEMDGLQGRGDVVVLAATNRPDAVDAALLRPGRFDCCLYVPPPESVDERMSILQVLTRRTPLAPDVDLAALAASTAGYTGADLSALVREAGIKTLEEDVDSAHVGMRHFQAALQIVLPSPPASLAQAAMYAAFRQGVQ